ncbi:hypothetical protein [Actinocorallia sp. A-T 12471]|uniref:hypothetical protein n=1 Tax=Actinocorallia sp. A-T 12471 TaxID=3089813 RepID=UPI0029D2AEC9|nr:hypothetical protein [Actinocorallia sp. A-T 12471]MDX6744127.1 hypothetical protein [Actinocorallia sp. A-T 12471]
MTVPPLPALTPRPPWTAVHEPWGRARGVLRLSRPDGAHAEVRVERCAAGRLSAAYPISALDVEISLLSTTPAATEALNAVVEAIWTAEPRCRRIVLAAPNTKTETTALRAGFRPTVEIDLPNGPVTLLVREPPWATHVDMDLTRIPT